MGKFISKLVFIPPNKACPIDLETDVILTTRHNSKIQVKIIDRKAKLNMIVSHGNAEDISSVHEWAINTFLEYVNVNVIIYGKKNE
jgi:predicted transcriptional regulator